MGTATPHDSLFHLTFHHPHHAAGWLRTALPTELAAAIDWASLRGAPEKVHGHALRLQVTDILFEVALGPHRHALFVLPEHKSWLDDEVHHQLVCYCTHVAQSTRGTSAPPALVLPLLLCHGRTTWPDSPPPHPHLDGLDPAAATRLAGMQPQLRFVVDDFMAHTETELRRPGLTALAQLTLLCLRFLRGLSAAEALAALDRWGDLLRDADRDDGPPPGPDAVAAIGWYVLAVTEIPAEELHVTFQRNLKRPEETIMSTAEKLRLEGRAETILRVLAQRFGPLPAETTLRVRAGSLPDLERWTDRVLDARTLADVFTNQRGCASDPRVC